MAWKFIVTSLYENVDVNIILVLDYPIINKKVAQAPNTLSQEEIQPQRWALQDVLNDSFVCYQDLSEYVGLKNIEWGKVVFLALNKHYLT